MIFNEYLFRACTEATAIYPLNFTPHYRGAIQICRRLKTYNEDDSRLHSPLINSCTAPQFAARIYSPPEGTWLAIYWVSTRSTLQGPRLFEDVHHSYSLKGLGAGPRVVVHTPAQMQKKGKEELSRSRGLKRFQRRRVSLCGDYHSERASV